MIRHILSLLSLLSLLALLSCGGRSQKTVFTSARDVRPASYAGDMPRFRALLYYSDHVEEAHRQFTHQSIAFFDKLTVGDGWKLEADTTLLGKGDLSQFDVIIMPDVHPGTEQERTLFESYMENGGGWLGFHAAAYNDQSLTWPWFRTFLGGSASSAIPGLRSRPFWKWKPGTTLLPGTFRKSSCAPPVSTTSGSRTLGRTRTSEFLSRFRRRTSRWVSRMWSSGEISPSSGLTPATGCCI